jgi:hypothetical protein
MQASPICRRWSELVSMANTDAGQARIQMEYLRIAANLSASALVVLSVTPIHMIEAILNHEFPPNIVGDQSASS